MVHCIYQFRILKSNNGVAWKIVDRLTVGTSNTDTSNWASDNTTSATKKDKTFTLPNPEVGRYWRVVIEKIYQKTIGNGGKGPITKEIQTLYFDIVKGKSNQYKHWLSYCKED